LIVVSDTSPILGLAVTGHLHLLEKLYGQVILPEAVFQELTSVALVERHTRAIATLPWVQVRPVADRRFVETLLAELDRGEAEAIAVAREVHADLLLIDERRGRRVASRFGLKLTGLIGVLAEAKKARLLLKAKPLLDDLIAKAGFGVGSELYSRFLLEVGEQAEALHRR